MQRMWDHPNPALWTKIQVPVPTLSHIEIKLKSDCPPPPSQFTKFSTLQATFVTQLDLYTRRWPGIYTNGTHKSNKHWLTFNLKFSMTCSKKKGSVAVVPLDSIAWDHRSENSLRSNAHTHTYTHMHTHTHMRWMNVYSLLAKHKEEYEKDIQLHWNTLLPTSTVN